MFQLILLDVSLRGMDDQPKDPPSIPSLDPCGTGIHEAVPWNLTQ